MHTDDNDFGDQETAPESPQGRRKRPKGLLTAAVLVLAGCGGPGPGGPPDAAALLDGAMADAAGSDGASTGAALPLVLVADVPLPGGATRFDYQEIDPGKQQLVVAHMLDNAVLVLALADGSVRAQLPNIATPRGVAVADDAGRIFVTSTPSFGAPGQLVIIDNQTLMEVARVATGTAPDGDGWDPVDQTVGVSDQGDGAISLLPGAGMGTRKAIPLGTETGNVVFDPMRKHFWITAVQSTPPDQLVEIDPVAGSVVSRIGLPGCAGAHGLRLHPDGQSAFIACENNDQLARVDLGGAHAVSLAASGAGPDVLSIDPGIGWLYLAAESGDLTVFDIGQPGAALVGHDMPGANSHSVAADPVSHRVFFPLVAGPNGTPVLRIMRPSGI